MLNGINVAILFFPNSFIWTNGYYIIVNWRSIRNLFSIYVPLKMLFRWVWYFDFAYFNMTVVKNLNEKIPFYDVFSKCLCSFGTSQFFSSVNLFQKNDSPLSKIQFLYSFLVFLSLNNPSQGQYVSIGEFSGSSILLN